jgi:hypothetical protein
MEFFNDIFGNLIMGFGVAVSLENLLYCFVGCLLGTLAARAPAEGRRSADGRSRRGSRRRARCVGPGTLPVVVRAPSEPLPFLNLRNE